MREWFLILGGVMIVGVLAHGAWLFFRARRQAVGVRYERNIPEVDLDDIELLRAELPSGGARVRNTPVGSDAPPAETPGPEPADAEPGTPARRAGVDLDARVPVLMDPIDRDSTAPAAGPDAEIAEGAGGPEPAPVPDPRPEPPPAPASREADPEPPAPAEPEPALAAAEPAREPEPESQTAAEPELEPEPESGGIEQTPLFANEPIVPREKKKPAGRREAKGGRDAKDGGAAKTAKERVRRRAGRREPQAPESSPAPLGPPEDVIVINVLRRGGGTLAGADLLEAITDAGLRFGDMNIFHRYAANDRKRIEWSLASAVEPGTFDLGAMDEFETRGVTLFLQLPGPEQPLESLEDMVAVARDLAERLDAELKDEQHSVMTAQTIEHCRNRIREFARRQMSKRAGR
jgi:cell division protein ZipA